ncbi:MAG: 50S ribosomal protein L15 [Candidatus Zixiibacteriota bacterium]
MELHNLKPPKGSKKNRKRLGRGAGSGMGETSGRGHKGQKARSGGKKRPGHEGGQMPIYRRLPKRGFHNFFKTEFQIVNVADLSRCTGKELTTESLLDAGLIRKAHVPVKILGNGKLEKPYTVNAHAFSKSAREKIEHAGGKALIINTAQSKVA